MAVTSSSPVDSSPIASTDEYLVVLVNAGLIDRLLRKDDFLDEGVAAVFGVARERTELPILSFDTVKFTPIQITAWLTERKFTPLSR